MKYKLAYKILILTLLFGSTAVLYLFLSGVRPNFGVSDETQKVEVNLAKTGMISVKSQPDGSNVYFNDELVGATNTTISGIKPGKHKLRISKTGYITWEKEIEVFEELVTDITAVLITQTPRLEPLTNTGARKPTISYNLDKIAFFSKDPDAPGVWVVNFRDQGLSLFRNSAKSVLKDNNFVKFSEGKDLVWSPNEDELLIETSDSRFYLLKIATTDVKPVPNPNELKDTWKKSIKKKRLDFISRIEIPEEKVKLASNDDTIWSPDNKKFLYTVNDGKMVRYLIYNMEKPLPIGEKEESTVFEYPADLPQPKITWYTDSYHLVVVEDFKEVEKKGKVSIIRIDGTNKVEVYNSALYSADVYNSFDGNKLIVLTSFKSGDQSDLYTLGIR
jgi:hypothetical protein